MKTRYYFFLLLFLPFRLLAQGYFPLQQGDWFEMQVTEGPENGPYTSKEPMFLPSTRYYLRYHLTKQLPNGNQQYKIEEERVIMHISQATDDGWMGYDSYYPLFKQQLSTKADKGAYLMEITSKGKIISLVKDSLHLLPRVTVYYNSPRKHMNMYATVTIDPLAADLVKKLVVEPMFKYRNPKTGLTYKVNDPELSYSQLLTAASFPIPGNVLIQGVTDAKKVTIGLGDSIWKCPVNNGSFSYPLFLASPQQAWVSFNDHSNNLFLKPGDTIFINQQHKVSGNAAVNSQLADSILKLFGTTLDPLEYTATHKLSEVLLSEQKATIQFDNILKSFEGRAAPVCIDYFKTFWQYRLAHERLNFLLMNNYQVDASHLPFQGFPEEVTNNIDNMPILLTPYPQEQFYRFYINEYVAYQQARISIATGGNAENFGFYADYSAILSTLKRYPLYYRLSEGIDVELKKSSWTVNRRLKPYYEDFINSCGDSSMTAPLIKNWQLMERWAPGNQLPAELNEILKPGKGKTTCLLLNYYGQENAELYQKLVASHPEVHFIYAQIKQAGMYSDKDTLIRNMPNVTVVELKNYKDKNYEVYGIDRLFQNNYIVLDQWGRIIDDHLSGTDDNWTDMNVAIRKAAESPHLTASQKANIVNIIGWSFCSILLTSLIGFWFYRVRIRSIKLKNTIQELEVKAIRSQMNPHFIFNALNSIQSLITTSQYKAANTYLVKFSQLLRNVLNNAERNTLPLTDELSSIKLYCELEQLRFDFSFAIETPEDIDVEIPGMIIQPLVENSILHGLASKGKEGHLLIKIEKQEEFLLISVYDNGAGFSSSPSSHKSVGLKLVRQRLQLFSKASLKYIFQNGTTAVLTIPV